MNPAIWLTPGQLADRSGVAVSALHYYESRGLITSRRTSGNQRRYRRDTLRKVAFIKVAQGVGVSLDEIKEAFDSLPDSRVPTTEDWARLSRAWHDRLTRRIEDLTALRDSFTDCIGCGCLSLASCPLANPGDVLGQQGPGPRRLPVHDDDPPVEAVPRAESSG
ncbi:MULTISPECIES: redox-sensitive transcriptional activator SoxR [Rhodococcus]|jgi:MerR family redox-sensitive transcriptional activator SoxR|uniref:Transcriptional regulator n=1 Tax=Rhodococcus pyridinivorans KG-16 TaxID=1441730 RepID=A0A0V9UH41_9NOCA|nr:redox-sensitive transcriptional activator SoxR [Rhodococcus pyridinivorans]KSZ57349.1 transcriptional regulator [Rhodococcus pyridinivorans KG-16]